MPRRRGAGDVPAAARRDLAHERGGGRVGSRPGARLRRVRGGDRERAVGMAWRLLGGDRAAAEDVAQEAFARAHRALGGFRGEASLPTWFFRILVNEVQRHRRWRWVRERFGGAMPEEPPDPRPAAAGDPALRGRIASALERLPRGQREAFVLVHLEGLSLREAAETTGRATGTLKSHLHRGCVRCARSSRTSIREGRPHDLERRRRPPALWRGRAVRPDARRGVSRARADGGARPLRRRPRGAPRARRPAPVARRGRGRHRRGGGGPRAAAGRRARRPRSERARRRRPGRRHHRLTRGGHAGRRHAAAPHERPARRPGRGVARGLPDARGPAR